jgi:hypothetical protein
MDATNDPATENQLAILRQQFHYEPDHVLTRIEAAHLIGDLRRRKEHPTAPPQQRIGSSILERDSQRFGLAVQNAKQALAVATISRRAEFERLLTEAMRKRQDFWMDTCRDPMQMQSHASEVWDLYMKYGCRFVTPARPQVQEVLDALDSALLDWEKNHAELFFRTLELNFPGLLRHS